MNNILQLKGQFQKRKNMSGFGPINLPKGRKVTAAHINNLKKQLTDIFLYWQNDRMIGGALVSVHYRCIVAKSNRLQLFLGEGSRHPNQSIRGAKFVEEYNSENKFCLLYTSPSPRDCS